ncbi:MAG: hypothetical protein DBY45_06320 [Clostridiales bacterium]|nr:MAG: hypothetical protein DBY45_06320 [Clostridiales bacterium]
MKNSFFKKLISLAAACVMALSVMPATVGAAIYDRDPQYLINVQTTRRAFVSAGRQKAYEGDLVNLEVVADEGYMVDTIDIVWYERGVTRHTYLYEEDMTEKISDQQGIWQFEMPASDIDISVTLQNDWRQSQIEVKIYDENVNRGDIYSSKYYPYYGDTITLRAIPDDGYTIEYLKVNGKVLTPVKENYGGETEFNYTVDEPRINITANFVRMDKSTYSVSVNTLDGGKAYLNATTAKAGDRVTLTVTPDKGKKIDTVKYGSTVLQGKDGIYTFTMPPQNVNLSITFKSDGTEPVNPSAPTWVQVGGHWRIKNTDGSYITGWYKMDNQWYYMDGAGDMLTGWQLIDNTWYYLKSYGAMATGWQLINGTWYYFKDWGGMATGWLQLGNTWYYLKSNGMMATGWNWIGNKCYYFYTGGNMAYSTTINGYKLNASGAWIA